MVQNFRKILWTVHSEIKMRQYGLSKTKLLSILRTPERKEQGIVSGTMAVMKTNRKFGNKPKLLLPGKWRPQASAPGEIWLMFRDTKEARKIISAWRYPGISKPGEEIPIPEDIRQEILKEN